MSPRNFARVFRRQVGKTPAAFVEQVRAEAARRQLELPDQGHARIAVDCGFGSEETLRRGFHRVLGSGLASIEIGSSERDPRLLPIHAVGFQRSPARRLRSARGRHWSVLGGVRGRRSSLNL
jgi:hypothetical protein